MKNRNFAYNQCFIFNIIGGNMESKLESFVEIHSPSISLSENHSKKNSELFEVVDCLFEEFKVIIESVNLDIPAQENDKEECLLIEKFTSISSLNAKIVLMQRLFNASFKNREKTYFIPCYLISKMYPKLTDYINFRDSSYERIFKPKGIQFIIDFWKSSGKLSSEIVDCLVCPSVEDLKAEIDKIKEFTGPLSHLFLVQMGDEDNDSLKGDHTVTIFITNQLNNKIEILITDSAGAKRQFLDLIGEFIHTLLPEADILGFRLARQTNTHSCSMFALNDARMICHHPEQVMNFVRSQNMMTIRNYKVFDSLPPEMMKFNQISTQELRSCVHSSFLLCSKENLKDTRVVADWRKKGLLITDRQLSKNITNIQANNLFAKWERKILKYIVLPVERPY
jgi:hypothetical protein